jgi:glutathione S-transferase
MLTIYGSAMSSAKRSIWLMEELGLPYEVIRLNMSEKEHKGEQYLALNPNGKVPALVDGEFTIWESSAINVYLAEKHAPEMLGTGAEERGLIAQWSYWNLTELYRSIEPLAMQQWMKTPDTEETKNAPEQIKASLAILDKALEGKEYLVANRFTVADIAVGSSADLCGWLQIDTTPYANFTAWMARIQDRPAYKKITAPAA